MKPKPMLEKDVQKQVVALYVSVGCHVWPTSQRAHRAGRGARPKAGLPDLVVMRLGLGTFFHEVKTPTGRLEASQQGFIRAAVSCDVPVVVGGYHEALAFLKAQGMVATVGLDAPGRPPVASESAWNVAEVKGAGQRRSPVLTPPRRS